MKTWTNMPISDSSATNTSPKQKPARPLPIDINLAEQMRTLRLPPRTRTSSAPTPSSASHSSSTSQLGSPERTPLYVHIYAQMRSPSSSTPFPSIMTTPARVPPNTAVYQPEVAYTPSAYSSSSSAHTGCFCSPMSSDQYSPRTVFRSIHNQATVSPFARSRRMELLRKILVDPIDTNTRRMPANSKWFQMMTPIYRRWELFRQPSLLRLARLAEDAWYGVEDSPDMPGGFPDGQESDMEEEEMSSADGWSGLSAPISPFEDELRRVAAGEIW